jgi:pilus assembly protein TadC
MLFDKKKRTINVGGKDIVLEPPRKGMGTLLGKKARIPSGAAAPAKQPADPAAAPGAAQAGPAGASVGGNYAKKRPATAMKSDRVRFYIESMGAKHKGLEAALRDMNIKESMYEFVKRMLIASIMLGVVLAITMFLLFSKMNIPAVNAVILSVMLGVAVSYTALGIFLNYPTQRSRTTSKDIERDILFAARDMIISLRSGMPLFNAITSISVGYGNTSKEFARIVERVQLGMPLEDAIDRTVDETKSRSFRRLMLQASVSIRAGADVVSALQGVIDQLSQERVIELRRYGQRLNAIAMFYMLFGIILPSMGVAVLTILTTFIAIFTVTPAVLEFVIVGLLFLQVIFLQLISGSRPVFAM